MLFKICDWLVWKINTWRLINGTEARKIVTDNWLMIRKAGKKGWLLRSDLVVKE